MFSDILKEITGSLDERFALTLFFPSLLFWGALVAVFMLAGDTAGMVAAWNAQVTAMKWLQTAAGLIWVAFFAHLLSHWTTWLTRQYEGYWNWPLGGRLRRLRTQRYAHILAALKAEGDAGYERIYYGFPLPDEPDDLMPTRLGNILKNAELYSLHQYEADAVLLWPRLYAVLPESFTAALAGTKAPLDLMLILSALSALFALVSSAGLLILGGPWWLFLACFLGGLIIARLAYLSGVNAAVPYAQLIKSAFDLYRGDLAEKMGYELPGSPGEETAFWKNLGELIYRGVASDPTALRYKARKPPAPDETLGQMIGKQVKVWIGKRQL
jgi:hypothetical protein